MDLLERAYGRQTFAICALFMRIPGSNVWPRRFFVTYSILVLSFATVFQVLLFVTQGFTMRRLIEVISTLAAIFGCLVYILYLTFAARGQCQKILSIMWRDSNEKRTAEEDAIKRQFMVNAKTFTNIYTELWGTRQTFLSFVGFLISMLTGVSLTGFIAPLLDILIPLNQSRKKDFLYIGDIFIDQEKYFYHIYFVQCNTAVVVGILVIISENLGIIIQQHFCGMLAVLGYQLRNITEMQELNMSDNIDHDLLITRRIQTCVKSHQKILEYAVTASEFYDVPMTIVLAGSFCTLTMSMVQVTDPEQVNSKILIFTLGQFLQFLLLSCLGQNWIDRSFQISEDAYYAKWDTCPANVRKMLQLIILRSSKSCKIFARGVYVISIENFMSVIQAVTSFFMVFRGER